MSRIIALGWAAALAVVLIAADLPAQEPHPEGVIDFESVIAGARAGAMQRGRPNPFRDFNEVTKGAEKTEGLFTLYKTGDHLYGEIRPDQFNQTLLVPITIARGLAQAGVPVGDDDTVLIFRRVGERIQLVRRNIHYKATGGASLDKSVHQNYTDSVLMALPIIALNPLKGGAALIDFSDIFMTDFAELNLGMLDRGRSSWTKVKGFPHNMELELEATFSGGGRRRSFMGHSDGVADHRGITVVIHYSLMKTPDHGYQPRTADDRVGHFLSATKDFGVTDSDSNFVRMINRWRLEKANPRAKLSPPKKQIVWYVEDTVPIEYRPYVEEGIREWNKAFEKIGFKDAIAVRWEEAGRDDFDPEDTNYCTFRWITNDSSYARSCLRASPLTGEMIDGDVVFDASFIRYWKQQYALLIGSTTAAGGQAEATPLALGEVISPILAAKMGYGQPQARALLGMEALDKDPNRMVPEIVPANHSPLAWELAKNFARGTRGFCQFQTGLQNDFGLASIALADTKGPEKPPADKAAKKPQPKDELPEEFVGQAIKEIVMHEVGHSLGLRHNFKASTMLTANQLNDTSITRVKGLVGSVMDYSPVNIAPKGKKQGDYYTTTLGPYDYWAIEYAYKPVEGDEATELKKVASRAPEHDLVYATDEDSILNDDPYANRWDLGSDPCEFGKARIALASDLLKDLDARVVKDGDSWTRTRRAFGVLLEQWGDGATLASQYIGGQSVSRDHKADKDARDPIVPVAGAKQRECLKFITDSILSDKAFQFSPALLRRLGTDRWNHWGSEGFFGSTVDISVLERILGIQKIALGHCLSPATLARIENQQLQAEPGSDPLRLEQVFRSLTDGIWSDLDHLPASAGDKTGKFALSTIRRNLQREYLRRLSNMVLGSSSNSYGDMYSYMIFLGGNGSLPADARALARLHLKEINSRISKVLETSNLNIDDPSRAHLDESRHRITKVLEANLDAQP
ncbi:MAG: zinc-dependent metalloprotease [Isosphaerales bacterium]